MMRRPPERTPDPRPWRVAGVFCLAAVLLPACDAAFSPFPESEAEPFAVMHGVLDSAADTQYVRVQTLRTSIARGSEAADTLTVRSTTPGDADRVWSLEADLGSADAPVFFAAFRPVAGREYRVTVAGSSGRSASRTVIVPGEPNIVAGLTTYTVSDVIQSTTLVGLTTEPERIDVEYEVTVPDDGRTELFDVDYRERGQRRSNGWEIVVPVLTDLRALNIAIGRDPTGTPLEVRDVRVSFDLLSPEWVFAEAPLDGFLGGIGRFSLSVPFSGAARDSINFVP